MTRYSDYSDTHSDDSRNCLIEGCKKKHAFAQFVDTKIYSKYCYKHTCGKTGSISDGYHCPIPKRESDRYCTEHMRCGESGCREIGEYPGKPGDEYIQWFCARHRCTMPRCPERAHNRQQQRCLRHFMKCTVAGCDRPCHENRDGKLDMFCAAHYGSYKTENKCIWPGCTRRKPGYDGKYCLDHKCELLDCEKSRDPKGAGKLCTLHRCDIPSCPKPIADPKIPDSHHCIDHTCNTRLCIEPRQSGSDFCPSHRCRSPHCRFEARFSKGYCIERHGCSYPMCFNSRSASLGVLSDRCEEHQIPRARRSSAADMPDPSKWERRRNRYSDDVTEAMRRREKEREQRDQPYDPYRYPNWDRYLDD
ncbi:hypothetical protein QBC38DRAFT_141869 [Podospora fimiseda]|uniref:Uncharacterized protein n=1 Tax=Podospora fimiseda TaxID=252190 RepID=A0AAN7BET3_9PEZI|nr:hypothetical protein QBC38DRAFT_141869 [Podospora fimiseda]